MAKSNITRLVNTAPREKWVERISTAWREQVKSIFETGVLLEAAKAELQHGEWKKLIEDELPFSKSTAHSLIKIAACDHLRNVLPAGRLPANWTILNELTKLTEKQFNDAIKSGNIHPKMTRKDAAALRGVERKEPKKKDDSIKVQSLDDWCSSFSLQIAHASATLTKEEKTELFEHLSQAIAQLKRDE